MNLFEMAKIPLNKYLENTYMEQLQMELQKYLPVIAVSTAPLWGRLKAAFVIIPESTWTK